LYATDVPDGYTTDPERVTDPPPGLASTPVAADVVAEGDTVNDWTEPSTVC
jgi:hypothetical protein